MYFQSKHDGLWKVQKAIKEKITEGIAPKIKRNSWLLWKERSVFQPK